MRKCPRCGMKVKSQSNYLTQFDCETITAKGTIVQSEACCEIASLRKWKQVVLSHVEVLEHVMYGRRTGNHIARVDMILGNDWPADEAVAFDAEVQKEVAK